MRRINLQGQTFGLLKVIEFEEYRSSYSFWKCICSCGEIKSIRGSALTTGSTRTCTKGSCRRNYLRTLSISGHLASGSSGIRGVYGQYKLNARRRALEFNLSIQEFESICTKNCHYCGTAPSNVMRSRGNCDEFTYNGVDRLDNLIGYYLYNCIPCCRTCNWAKGKKTLKEFELWLENLVNYRLRK